MSRLPLRPRVALRLPEDDEPEGLCVHEERPACRLLFRSASYFCRHSSSPSASPLISVA